MKVLLNGSTCGKVRACELCCLFKISIVLLKGLLEHTGMSQSCYSFVIHCHLVSLEEHGRPRGD